METWIHIPENKNHYFTSLEIHIKPVFSYWQVSGPNRGKNPHLATCHHHNNHGRIVRNCGIIIYDKTESLSPFWFSYHVLSSYDVYPYFHTDFCVGSISTGFGCPNCHGKFPTAVTVGFPSLVPGVVRCFVSAGKIGTEPRKPGKPGNLKPAGCKTGWIGSKTVGKSETKWYSCGLKLWNPGDRHMFRVEIVTSGYLGHLVVFDPWGKSMVFISHWSIHRSWTHILATETWIFQTYQVTSCWCRDQSIDEANRFTSSCFAASI